MREDGWRIGDASLAPVHETDAGRIIQAGIPAAKPERLAEISWLVPRFADPEGDIKAVVQAFVIILDGTRVLVGKSHIDFDLSLQSIDPAKQTAGILGMRVRADF